MTDRELMQQALDALEKHVLEYETAEALRARLAQPERAWQGLTDEEIAACIQMGESGYLDGFVKPLATYRVIEAKLKEKNGV